MRAMACRRVLDATWKVTTDRPPTISSRAIVTSSSTVVNPLRLAPAFLRHSAKRFPPGKSPETRRRFVRSNSLILLPSPQGGRPAPAVFYRAVFI
jgi:hypothetical protein